MENENVNYPDQPLQPDQPNLPSKKKNNTWIYLGIIGLLLITNGVLFFQKQKTQKAVEMVTHVKDEAVSDRDNLQQEYNASLARLDQLTSENTQLSDQIKNKDADLAKTKTRIQQILSNQHATEKDLKEARNLIAGLNTKIDGYEKQIEELKGQNATLTYQRDSLSTTNNQLTSTNEGLQKQVNMAKVLHASNIRVMGIELRRGGKKEKEITKARRVDVFRVVFDIDENRLAENGTKELDIRIINPSGTLLSNAALGSGSFTNEETQQQVLYSLSKKVNLKTNQPLYDIAADWQQSADYEKGTYNVEIYNQGYLIGKGTATFR